MSFVLLCDFFDGLDLTELAGVAMWVSIVMLVSATGYGGECWSQLSNMLLLLLLLFFSLLLYSKRKILIFFLAILS